MITTDPNRDRRGFYVLRRYYSELYKKTNYLAPLTMVQNRITEYDIQAANITMLRQAHKVKPSTLAEIEALPKHDRQVIIGKMMKRDKSIKNTIYRGIIRAKQALFEANGVQDNEVLAIKNDAVFIIGRKLKTTQFGEVIFRPKHTYSLYLNIEGTEFYYDGKAGSITVKGISDTIVEDSDHQNGIVIFFRTVMKCLVLDRKDALRRYLIEFSEAYKSRELPIQYYKEFNSENVYRTDIDIAGYTFNLTAAGEGEKEIINPVYNYMRFVLPLIQAFI